MAGITPDIMFFSKMFDVNNPNFHNNSLYNETFISAQQNYINQRLEALGFLTVNDVFEALGFERTVEGMVYGWIRGETVNIQVDYPDTDELPFVLVLATTDIYKRLRMDSAPLKRKA